MDEVERMKFTDVDVKVMKIMRMMLFEADRLERLVDWDKFKDYCVEYFNLPECTIERCIFKIKEGKADVV